LLELRGKREQMQQAVRNASQRLTALKYTQPLTLAQVQDSLDRGTVLLSYMVGADRTFLFAVKSSADRGEDAGLRVLTIASGRQALRSKIDSYRDLMEKPAASTSTKLMEKGRELYELLVRPADDWLQGSERVLVSPDGPLHLLTFTTLVTRDGKYV